MRLQILKMNTIEFPTSRVLTLIQMLDALEDRTIAETASVRQTTDCQPCVHGYMMRDDGNFYCPHCDKKMMP